MKWHVREVKLMVFQVVVRRIAMLKAVVMGARVIVKSVKAEKLVKEVAVGFLGSSASVYFFRK